MKSITIVRALAILFTGLAAGALLGHRMGVSIARPQLSASAFVQLQQIIHAHFVVMMPILLFGAIGAGAFWVLLLRRRRSAEFWLALTATLAFVAIAAMTRAVNIPINEQLMGWSVASPPPNLEELWSPWERVHTIRTVIAVSAFALQAMALSQRRPSGD
jgi:uncharacterized membrane protein